MSQESQISIISFDPDTVADYLTSVDFEIFKKIHPAEFLKQGWVKPNASDLSPNIVFMTNRFNDIGLWVVYEALAVNTPKDRVQVILHFVMIAKALKDRNNFNGVGSILGGINNSSVTRLKKQQLNYQKRKIVD